MPLLAGCQTTGSGTGPAVLREVPREERTALMVINFRNTSAKDMADKYQPWEYGIPAMIMTDLETIGVFNILSWERIEDILEQQKFQSLGLVSEEEAVKIGKLAAARYTLAGTFMVMDGTLRMESKVFDVETGTQFGAASVTGKLDQFFDLEKKLVIKMTEHLGAVLTDSEQQQIASAVETRSVDASLSNYAGEMAVYEADRMKRKGANGEVKALLDQAKNRFEAALSADPGYERAKQNLASLTMAIPMTL
jgi:TolB-like protein